MPDDNGSDGSANFEDMHITADDISEERLTEILKHQRIERVRESDGTYQILTRDGAVIDIADPAEDNIWGSSTNPSTGEMQEGHTKTDDLSPATILELGDLVRLKRPADARANLPDMTHGIVVEILSYFGEQFDNAPRSVSLHPFNPATKEIAVEFSDHPSPTFYDQHVRELVLIQKATDDTYNIREIDITEYLDLGDQY